MRWYLIIILFFFKVSVAEAKNYYFSSVSGNDTYTSTQAQSPLTPWQTLSKLNSFFPNFSAGDSILFKSGETFNGSIIIAKSGTAVSPIVLGAYGTGAKPIISGLTTLSSWISLGGGIYQSNCSSCGVSANIVTVNGIQKAIGRYPNTGYLHYQSHAGSVSITDAQLTGTPNWTGAEVVIRKNHWIIDRNIITGQVGGTITYTSGSSYAGTDNYGYFIQNDPRTLDQLGEWYFNPANKNMQMYFGTADPSTFVVKASAIDNIVTISKFNYITFTNISFQGANMDAFNIGGALNISILNCSIDLSGISAVFGKNMGTSSANFNMQNATINHTNNNAISLPSEFTNASIQNNVIKNTAIIPGMGVSGDNAYQGINTVGNNSTVQYNELDSIGYSGIVFYGTSILIKNNFINYFCLLKDDGGGIYTYKNLSDPAQTGSQINGNIVLNGIGSLAGLSSTETSQAEGIYADGYTAGININNNTVANCGNVGLFINSNTGGSIKNNQFYNNKIQIYINQPNSDGTPSKNLSMYQNIVFPKQVSQLAFSYRSNFGNLDPTFYADSNFYARPFDDRAMFTTNYTSAGNTFWYGYDLPSWQLAYNIDKNAGRSPISIPYYTINSLGTNKYTYGTFEGRTDLPFVSPANTSYDNTGKIDGIGSLKVSYSSISTNNLLNVNVSGLGVIDSTKNYILRFSTVGVTPSRIIGVYLAQVASPFANLTPVQYIPISAARTDNEILFSAPVSSTSGKIVFQLNTLDGTMWFDNIQLFEANVSIPNPDDYIRFEYNATASTKVVSLSKPYIDVRNNYYVNNISLKPYSSAILIDANAGCKCDKPTILLK